jgi:hypothetical protein
MPVPKAARSPTCRHAGPWLRSLSSSPNSIVARYPLERPRDFFPQLSEVCLERGFFRMDHNVNCIAKLAQAQAYSFAQPPPYTVALHGRTQHSRNGEAHARGTWFAPILVCMWEGRHKIAAQKEEGHVRGKNAATALVHLLEVGVSAEPCRPPKPGGNSASSRHVTYLDPRHYSRKPGFTETRFRPLARRRASTARPPLVLIRTRNPCVLERRRRFGWNVRFGMNDGAPAQNFPLRQEESINEPCISGKRASG